MTILSPRSRATRRWIGTALLAGGLAACGSSSDDDGIQQLLPASGATLASCSDLAARIAQPNTVFSAITTAAAGALTVGGVAVPEHCVIDGRMFDRVSAVDGQSYAIGFQIRLPKAWNGRFFYQANGGIDGTVVPATGVGSGGGPLTSGLMQGFAVISSDAGHSAAQNPVFGIDPQARLDYGYQAVGKLTPMAKAVVQAAYGKGPDRSYLVGCSNGGRHALVAAARYADQYDGILAGAPGFNLPKAAIANIFGAQRYATVATNPADLSTGWTAAERTLVSKTVIARCDALDGATDGLIQDTAACQATFKLETDVPTCTGARDGSCLTAAQKSAIAAIFAGPKTKSGAPVYATFPFDGGHGGAGIAFWEFTASLVLDSGAVGFIFGSPPVAAAGFNGPAFSLGADIDAQVARINATSGLYTESGMSFMTPPNPSNLSALKARGAKLMVYHGVSDPIFSVDDTSAWYQSLMAANGGDASNFARFFRVPSMGHCSGGPAVEQFDMLTPLVAWVEKAQAPDRVIATARGTGNAGGVNAELPAGWAATRTRPLCPFPTVARYNGTGDLEKAENFSCK